MGFTKYTRHILAYIWKKSRWQLVTALAAIFILGMAWILHGSLGGAYWDRGTDQGLSLITVLMAVFIWINSQRQEWKRNLPMKLDVRYDLNGEDYYTVINAPLAGDDDIRQWGQQLGKQINNLTDLPFSGFKLAPPRLETDEHNIPIIKYSLTIWLFEQNDEDYRALVKENRGYSWKYDTDGKISKFNAEGQLIEKQ